MSSKRDIRRLIVSDRSSRRRCGCRHHRSRTRHRGGSTRGKRSCKRPACAQEPTVSRGRQAGRPALDRGPRQCQLRRKSSAEGLGRLVVQNLGSSVDKARGGPQAFGAGRHLCESKQPLCSGLGCCCSKRKPQQSVLKPILAARPFQEHPEPVSAVTSIPVLPVLPDAKDSGVPISARFCFYDQIHTTGAIST